MLNRRNLLLASAALAGSALVGCAEGASPRERSSGSVPRPSRPAGNTIALSGSATDYPLRIARPFRQGEIRGAPQATIGGRPVPTQADVKTRWPDGSVQHAVISLVVPRTGGAVIGFVDGPATGGGAGDPAALLALDFDAAMQLTGDNWQGSASARAMLARGHFTTWCHGPVATIFIVADHSAQRQWDMGPAPLRPVRPIFHVTHWHGLRRVHVRAIGEVANTEALTDTAYALVLTAGQAKPREAFRQDAVPHYLATRWTRRFWLDGAEDPAVSIDHNLPYLASTLLFPNFDPDIDVSDRVLAADDAAWRRRPMGLYEDAGWAKYMPTTGGRADIGPYPDWVVKWLYTGDHRFFERTQVMADAAGAWPMVVREGNPAKRFDAAGTVPAIGRVVSGFARPTLWLLDSRDRSRPGDRVTVQGERLMPPGGKLRGGGWVADQSHEPDAFSALYALTGDFYALEQMQFWTATGALRSDPGFRGAPDIFPILSQVRGMAWGLRSRAHAATLSPEDTPERAYFRLLCDQALGFWEGSHGLRGGAYDGTPAWRAGASSRFVYPSPLGLFADLPMRNDLGILPDRASTATGLWQHYFLIFELGRARERGLPAGPLLAWTGAVLTGQFRDPAAYNPWNLQRYYTPARDPQRQFFRTWPETLAAYRDPPRETTQGGADAYTAYAYGASTMIVDLPGGREAYDWLRRNVYQPNRARFAQSPKWAFVPRQA